MPGDTKPVSAETLKAFGKMVTTPYLTSTALNIAVHFLMRRSDDSIKCFKGGYISRWRQSTLSGLTRGFAADVLGALAVLADGGISVFHQVVVSGAFEVRAVLF